MTTILLLIVAGQYTPFGFFPLKAECEKARLEHPGLLKSDKAKLECRTITTRQANMLAEALNVSGSYRTRYQYQYRRFRP